MSEVDEILAEPREAAAQLAERREKAAHLQPDLQTLALREHQDDFKRAIRIARGQLQHLASDTQQEASMTLRGLTPKPELAALYSEIRQFVRDLEPVARLAFIRERIAAKDVDFIAAVVRGPAYLSGLTDIEQADLRLETQAAFADPGALKDEIMAARAELAQLENAA